MSHMFRYAMFSFCLSLFSFFLSFSFCFFVGGWVLPTRCGSHHGAYWALCGVVEPRGAPIAAGSRPGRREGLRCGKACAAFRLFPLPHGGGVSSEKCDCPPSHHPDHHDHSHAHVQPGRRENTRPCEEVAPGRTKGDRSVSLTVSTPQESCSQDAPPQWGRQGLAGKGKRRQLSAAGTTTWTAPGAPPRPRRDTRTCWREPQRCGWACPQPPQGASLARHSLRKLSESAWGVRGLASQSRAAGAELGAGCCSPALHTPPTGGDERRGPAGRTSEKSGPVCQWPRPGPGKQDITTWIVSIF